MGAKAIKGKVLPIGVDLGTSALKLAQLRELDGSHDLIASASADVPPECWGEFRLRLEFWSKALAGLVRTGGFQGRECVLGVPAEATFVRHLRVPKGTGDSVDRAVLGELQGKLPFPAADAEIRHVVAGEVLGDGEPRQEVIVVAVPRTTVLSLIRLAGRARLDVVGVNVEAFAIVECFGRLFRRAADQKRAVLFIDMGQASTQVVLSHGSRVVFARNLPMGGAALDKAIADDMGITPQRAAQLRQELAKAPDSAAPQEELYGRLSGVLETLADELTQCIRYYESVFRNQGIERAIFLGGQAHDKRLCQSVAQRLNLPAQIGDPLVRIGGGQGASPGGGLDRREPQPRWAVAVGLSLGSAQAA